MSQKVFKAEILPIREKLFHLAKKYLEDEQDAEDAIQETFLKLWHNSDSLSTYDNPAAYATTGLKNHCLDNIKLKKNNIPLDESYYLQAGTENPYLELEYKSSEALIRKIIESLPTLQQEIIRMKDIEEYEIEEIAEITGTKAEAVRVNLSRARKKVREEYIKWTSV